MAGTLGSCFTFSMSPADEAADEAEESPDTDLRSSVSLAGATRTRDKRDIDRSRGESETRDMQCFINLLTVRLFVFYFKKKCQPKQENS